MSQHDSEDQGRIPSELKVGELSFASRTMLIDLFRQLYAMIFFGMLLIFIVSFVLLLPFLWNFVFFDSTRAQPPLIMTIMLCGAIGAEFSILTRIYSLREIREIHTLPGMGIFFPSADSVDSIDDQISNIRIPTLALLPYSLTPPLIGSISAIVLYLLFAGRLITGALFPDIVGHTVNDAALSPAGEFFSEYGPKDGSEYAKVLLWSFVAGFAERLIPSVLDSLGTSIASASKDVAKKRDEKVR